MIKLLIKLLGDRIYQPGTLESKKMKDWLFRSYQNDGFKNYYTMRKKYLFNRMMNETDTTKRDETRGRYRELQMLCTNMNTEFKSRKVKNTK